MTSAPQKQQLLQDLMQNIEARKQTEQRLKATMGVLLARSENQILVLETLLKRLVQVCVHTQDKRLAKELKLMDFTRLAKKIGDEHTHMRQMLIHEDGMLGPSPAESFLMEPMHSNGVNGSTMGMQNARIDDTQIPGGNNMNFSQYRTQSQPSANQHVPQHPMQQQMMQHPQQQQKPPSTGPQSQHMSHMPHSQGPSLNQATSNGPPMRRDAGAGMGQGRDSHMQLRNLWPQDANLDNSNGLGGMPNGVPNLQGMQHPNHF